MNSHSCRPRFPWEKRIEPILFDLKCPQCDYVEMVEVAKDGSGMGYADSRIVSKLPSACPGCGAKLKQTKVPVKFYN